MTCDQWVGMFTIMCSKHIHPLVTCHFKELALLYYELLCNQFSPSQITSHYKIYKHYYYHIIITIIIIIIILLLV